MILDEATAAIDTQTDGEKKKERFLVLMLDRFRHL